MLTSTAIGAGDRLPVGCAVLVIILLSLLLWAILLIPLWQLFDIESVAEFRENIKGQLVIRSRFSGVHSSRRGISAAGFNGLQRMGKTGLMRLAARHLSTSYRSSLETFDKDRRGEGRHVALEPLSVGH